MTRIKAKNLPLCKLCVFSVVVQFESTGKSNERSNSVLSAMKLVLVEWVDSFGCSSSWQDLSDCSPEPLICKSVGWLAHDGENCKVVIPHMAEDHGSVKRQGCGDMTIPTKALSP